MTHISFSALKIWNECSYKHKLVYIDQIKAFKGNAYTAFGTALHDVCEKKLLGENMDDKDYFLTRFKEVLAEIPEEHNEKLVEDMKLQGVRIIPHIMPALNKYFKEYEVVSAEEDIFEVVDDYKFADFNFKGFIDLVLKTPDGKYHIIDWKTCSWGWDARRKNDKMTTYQLTFYKHFFAKKHNIDPENIETHFALLKRTARKENVEFFRVTSGQTKINNALNLLENALYNIEKNNHIKNRLSCSKCEFYKTVNCP
tara:strand:+ start:5444 stop:6208 length:765 start_codon:yes stop_codon:yes gene_type:complete